MGANPQGLTPSRRRLDFIVAFDDGHIESALAAGSLPGLYQDCTQQAESTHQQAVSIPDDYKTDQVQKISWRPASDHLQWN
jgi:hypothetical protein